MFKKILISLINVVPILLMIWLIPIITDDYSLTLAYIAIIMVAFFIKKEPKEIELFFIGFFVMILSEYVFTSTKVETFNRNSLFQLMPIWLPFLWGYSFVVMKRLIKILNY